MDKGLVDETFLDAIYEREKVVSTAFGNLVAIPHPITPKTKQTFVAVCTLEKPITWNETPVQLIFLLCVKKDSQEDLQEMYDLLGRIIDNNALVQKIVKVKNYDEFIHIIKEWKTMSFLFLFIWDCFGIMSSNIIDDHGEKL